MNPIARNIVAVLLGIVIGGSVNSALVSISGDIIALPDGFDPNDPESLIIYATFRNQTFHHAFSLSRIGNFCRRHCNRVDLYQKIHQFGVPHFRGVFFGRNHYACDDFFSHLVYRPRPSRSLFSYGMVSKETPSQEITGIVKSILLFY